MKNNQPAAWENPAPAVIVSQPGTPRPWPPATAGDDEDAEDLAMAQREERLREMEAMDPRPEWLDASAAQMVSALGIDLPPELEADLETNAGEPGISAEEAAIAVEGREDLAREWQEWRAAYASARTTPEQLRFAVEDMVRETAARARQKAASLHGGRRSQAGPEPGEEAGAPPIHRITAVPRATPHSLRIAPDTT